MRITKENSIIFEGDRGDFKEGSGCFKGDSCILKRIKGFSKGIKPFKGPGVLRGIQIF